MYLLTISTWNNCAEQDSASSASVRDSKANQPNELLQVACAAYSVDRFNKWSLRSVDHNVLGVLNEWTNGRSESCAGKYALKRNETCVRSPWQATDTFWLSIISFKNLFNRCLKRQTYKRFRFVALGLKRHSEEYYRRRSHFYISRC